MKNHSPFVLAVFFLGILFLTLNSCKKKKDNEPSASKPNIVFFLIDDIGVISTPAYSDNLDGSNVVSASQDNGYVQNGNSYYNYTTPNINKLASEALVFSKMYATPLCAPSRGQLMTGLYPFQTGIVYPCFPPSPECGTDWTFGPATPEEPGQGYLDTIYTTYPEMLREDGGYYTGFGGKWNLRWGVPNSLADQEPFYDSLVTVQANHLDACGFTDIYNPNAYTALIGNTVDYYPPQLASDTTNNEDYFPFSLNAWAQSFLDTARTKLINDGTPYYLHYCAGLIHDDFDDDVPKVIPGYPPNPTDQEHFGNKIHVVDSLIGIIINQIQNDPILSKNTIMIVAGDNGTEPNYTTKYRNQPTVGGKFSTKTYGSNVPFIIHWPDTLSAGTYTQLADFADVHSTITDIAGISDSSVQTSGYSFASNMKLPQSSRKETREYVFSQAFNLEENPEVPDTVALGNPDAFIANQYFSLIPTNSGGALFSIDPTSLQNIYVCENGCIGTEYADDYCKLYNELIALAPTFVPFDKSYTCES